MVTVFCPLTTTGPGETVVQIAAETRFVVDCKVNPAALVGHVKITFAPEGIIVSCVANERLNTVAAPEQTPIRPNEGPREHRKKSANPTRILESWNPARLDAFPGRWQTCFRMKIAASTTNGRPKLRTPKVVRPRMTAQLAEKRAVGDLKAPRFDGVTFLRSLKK